MTHLEYATPSDAEKVNKGKYFEKMSKLLSKKVGKKLTIHVIDKISMLKGSNNKPFPFFGKIDPKKSPEWAEKLKQEANMGKCLLEKKNDGSLEMQIKIKGCKKQQELVDFMSGEGIKVRFVDKLMKDGKELSDDDKDDEDDDDADVASSKTESSKDAAKDNNKDADKNGKENLQVSKEIDSIKKQINPLLALLQTEMPKMKGQPINDDLKSKGEQASQLITNFLKLWDTADDTVKTVNKEFKKTIDGFKQFWDKVVASISGVAAQNKSLGGKLRKFFQDMFPNIKFPEAEVQQLDSQKSQTIDKFLDKAPASDKVSPETVQKIRKFFQDMFPNIKFPEPSAPSGKTTMTKEESRSKIDNMKESLQKMKDAIKKMMGN